MTQANTWLVLTNPGAAHSVLRPLCLLPGFAAQPHVGYMVGFYWGRPRGFASRGDDPNSHVLTPLQAHRYRFSRGSTEIYPLAAPPERPSGANWALGASRSAARPHGASRGALRWLEAFTWNVPGTAPVRKRRHLLSVVLGNSSSFRLAPFAQVFLRRPVETSSRAGGADLVPGSATLLFDGASSWGFPGERFLSGCTTAILRSPQRDRLGRGASLRLRRGGPLGRWTGFSSFLWVYSVRLRPIANQPMQLSACLLRDRRCRPLAARTAAADWHVGPANVRTIFCPSEHQRAPGRVSPSAQTVAPHATRRYFPPGSANDAQFLSDPEPEM